MIITEKWHRTLDFIHEKMGVRTSQGPTLSAVTPTAGALSARRRVGLQVNDEVKEDTNCRPLLHVNFSNSSCEPLPPPFDSKVLSCDIASRKFCATGSVTPKTLATSAILNKHLLDPLEARISILFTSDRNGTKQSEKFP